MTKDDQQISEGLNEIFEVINAKGDTGEIKEILNPSTKEDPKNVNK